MTALPYFILACGILSWIFGIALYFCFNLFDRSDNFARHLKMLVKCKYHYDKPYVFDFLALKLDLG